MMTLRLLLLCFHLAGCLASQSAKCQNEYGSLSTSSTLRWVRSGRGQTLPEHSVGAGTNGASVICRAKYHGTKLVGTAERGACKVGFTSRLYPVHRYEVLTNVDGSARLSWVSFNKYGEVPQGAVAGVDEGGVMFVSRYLSVGVMRPAVLEMSNTGYGFGEIKMFSDHGVEQTNDADLLVEVEPVRYMLDLHKFIKKPKKKKEEKTLTTASIFRFDEGKDPISRMQKILSYDYKKSMYFGQIKGMMRGLPTTVRLPTGENTQVLWGMKDTGNQKETLMVGFNMKKNSAVDVYLRCTLVEEEQAYTGMLTAIYKDGARRERKVEGVMLHKFMDNIRDEYSELYRIKDQVIVNTDATATQKAWVDKVWVDRRDIKQQDNEVMLGDQSKQHLLLAVQSSGGGERGGGVGLWVLGSVLWALLK